MNIDSTRAGKIEVREDTVIAFTEGLIGLGGPIVIHSDRRLGRQVINEVGTSGVREPLFSRVPLSEVRPAVPAARVAATGI
jgi:flagellar assembly factor FliW